MTGQTALSALLEIFDYSRSSRDLKRLAAKMEALTGRRYSFKYLHSVATGSLEPSKKLQDAIYSMLAHYEDGAPLELGLEEVTVRTSVKEQDQAMNPPWPPRPCEDCGAMFIGVAYRKYCYLCSPPK